MPRRDRGPAVVDDLRLGPAIDINDHWIALGGVEAGRLGELPVELGAIRGGDFMKLGGGRGVILPKAFALFENGHRKAVSPQQSNGGRLVHRREAFQEVTAIRRE